MPASVLAESATAGGVDAKDLLKSRPPRVEYLATLSRHSAAVNVVRFSPNGECGLELMRRSGVQVARRGWMPNASSHTSAILLHTEGALPEASTSRVIVPPFHFCLF